MTRSRPLRRSLVVLLAASMAALGACGDDDGDDGSAATTATDAGPTVSGAWARPATDLTASDRSAVYLVITGGDEDDELVSVSVPDDVAGAVELHETTVAAGDVPDGEDAPTTPDAGDLGGDDEADPAAGVMDGDPEAGADRGGMMQMRRVDSIVIPAGGNVSLEPGGMHVMLLDLQTELEPGDTIEVTLVFAEAGATTVDAEVREP